MASIAIRDLEPAGHSLFADSESYLAELTSGDELSISGGKVSSALSFATGVGVSILVVVVTVALLA